MKIRIATRKSELALFQANLVAEKLMEKNNALQVELVPMSSDGDETDAPLHQIGGKGLFINTLESALLEEKADIAVHSLKDVPAKLDENFCIAAVLKRASAGDMLLTNNGRSINDLAINSTIATSSPRRYAQIKNLHPEIKISSETGEGLKELKNIVSEMLFGGLLCGWVHFSPVQASVRSKLFDSGCILEEKTDSNGQHQSLVSISQSMLEQFEEIEIFKNLKPVSP